MPYRKTILFKKIINDDWSNYDAQKLKLDLNPRIYTAEDWEAQYLVNILFKYFPKQSSYNLYKIVLQCGMIKNYQCSREEIIQFVISRLL
ncbi:hypothetical protein OX284_012275 [Flavobacterium sp. SUN046]|uniref:hypothetical protein n=1 Tax=Flavobacterium sp. SUN046 TaxID=3002440 RepID=UPI002DB912DF|nr:hypothetical protein [Flavobacterium sp. SUN046]MEC4050210.1 hypothetical protein [Flavobacterium sp. SUN046]